MFAHRYIALLPDSPDLKRRRIEQTDSIHSDGQAYIRMFVREQILSPIAEALCSRATSGFLKAQMVSSSRRGAVRQNA